MNPSALANLNSGIFGQFFGRYAEVFWLLFRIGFAFLVLQHGLQKTFLLWGFPADHELGALVDIAGVVELFCAAMIAFGVFTRLAGGAMTVQLVVAYLTAHSERGFWPHEYEEEGFESLHHGGEVVMAFFLCAGIIGVLGSGKLGLERLIFKKELF
ncbi:MAG: DoxX family protein [Acidimicrobiaceae bacterium]|nr:DoxX family protein [Acidimicrobiaceae bacterium]MDE0607189.1 DoxX family protein [Acidimicrobiaceae bacterium]